MDERHPAMGAPRLASFSANAKCTEKLGTREGLFPVSLHASPLADYGKFIKMPRKKWM